MKHCLLILFAVLFGSVKAQQPAYFVLGEKQFKGIRVFDIIQDNHDFYYFATNEGIIRYDFVQFSKVETKQAHSLAFFNLTKNKNGVIFFNNLNNQIFKIENNVCKLIYSVPSGFNSNIIGLTCNQEGQLFICCRGVILIDTEGREIAKQESPKICNTSFKLSNGDWIFPKSSSFEYVRYSGHTFSTSVFVYSGGMTADSAGPLELFSFQDTQYAVDVRNKQCYRLSESKMVLNKIPLGNFLNSSTNARFYITGSFMWAASPFNGINLMRNTLSEKFQFLFKDYYISDVFQDKEGNILLGTFDNGVLVIPDLDIPDAINKFVQDPMISIYCDNGHEVYLGSNKGVFNRFYNGKLEELCNVNKKPIEGIYGDEGSDFIIYDDASIKCYNRKTKHIYSVTSASLKDVNFISAKEIYFGTNNGLYRAILNTQSAIVQDAAPELHLRIYSLAYLKHIQCLFISSTGGLHTLKDGKLKRIQYEGQDIFSEKISASADKVFVITQKFGVLVIDENLKITKLPIAMEAFNESINKIKAYQNHLYANTNHGLYQFDMNGSMLRQFQSSYGFALKKVYGFSVSNGVLWVSHSGGVQSIDLGKQPRKGNPLKVRIHEIRVNDSVFNQNMSSVFGADDHKFSFLVLSPSLRYAENIKFHYTLKGYDPKWYVQSLNQITFNALPPGDYTLIVKAEHMGEFSPEVRYAFRITKPYYLRLWFIGGCIILFLALVYFIYNRQVRKQKRRSQQINELNLSKLTAIQSQMNPHFIFNSLNSIQDLVLQQKATTAYESIGKFALLIRKIMHHSEKEFIDIEEELSILNVYLEMELLRFKKDFSYSINSNQISDIEVPPMLIQPLIENAIKHGLLHKEGQKTLTINMHLEPECFVCEISDNGIGRKRSQEIKERQNKLFESFSGQSLDIRLEILRRHHGGNFGVEIIDLYDAEKNATGTKVVLKSPFKRKF